MLTQIVSWNGHVNNIPGERKQSQLRFCCCCWCSFACSRPASRPAGQNVDIFIEIMVFRSSKCFPLQPQAFSAARGERLPLTPRAYPHLRIASPGVVNVWPTGGQLETGSQLSFRFLLFCPFGLTLDQYRPKPVRTRRVRVRFHPEERFLTHQTESLGRKIHFWQKNLPRFMHYFWVKLVTIHYQNWCILCQSKNPDVPQGVSIEMNIWLYY